MAIDPTPTPDDPIDLVPADTNDAAEGFGCQFCLGGFVPAGSHPILGLVYTACQHCGELCPCCTGSGLFPADTTCLDCLTEALAVLHLTPVFCHTCAGVTAIHQLTTE